MIKLCQILFFYATPNQEYNLIPALSVKSKENGWGINKVYGVLAEHPLLINDSTTLYIQYEYWYWFVLL